MTLVFAPGSFLCEDCDGKVNFERDRSLELLAAACDRAEPGIEPGEHLLITGGSRGVERTGPPQPSFVISPLQGVPVYWQCGPFIGDHGRTGGVVLIELVEVILAAGTVPDGERWVGRSLDDVIVGAKPSYKNETKNPILIDRRGRLVSYQWGLKIYEN